jgi:hypothetical protein
MADVARLALARLGSLHAAPSDAMPKEIDFSAGTRGKFYRPDAKLRLPRSSKP